MGRFAVMVVCPSLTMQFVRPLLAISERVLLAHVLEIVVPVTTGLPETRLKVPEPLNAIFHNLQGEIMMRSFVVLIALLTATAEQAVSHYTCF